MASQDHGAGTVHHGTLDALAWPLAVTSPLVWPIAPWASWLWEYFPTPTAIYMIVSAGFMLFQMADKVGMLERFKRHHKPIEELPEVPGVPEHHGDVRK